MIRINIHEAKTHLSRYLTHLSKGETILLYKRNTPIAEIRPLPPRRVIKTPLGMDKGKVKISKEVFAPLPEDLLDLFEGKG